LGEGVGRQVVRTTGETGRGVVVGVAGAGVGALVLGFLPTFLPIRWRVPVASTAAIATTDEMMNRAQKCILNEFQAAKVQLEEGSSAWIVSSSFQ
jgi:hypothetical protein